MRIINFKCLNYWLNHQTTHLYMNWVRQEMALLCHQLAVCNMHPLFASSCDYINPMAILLTLGSLYVCFVDTLYWWFVCTLGPIKSPSSHQVAGGLEYIMCCIYKTLKFGCYFILRFADSRPFLRVPIFMILKYLCIWVRP